ncbi:Rab3 GTPase-activating protein catalytic subunit [Entomortierella parvispora]|uniref:Rab3 GTPase-activating protein catalytic subunit n=1 Tax=Entomortierella parvispora TaxID=205924 RepID=A0A9P3H4H3_9FUNG|nr:Rab3 GTPase-activating protein catalytic subunit [Entomortierella parvispora]
MDDFENFEFIDYTTSGPWERFITQIEDTLRTWGLVDRSLGLLDPALLSQSSTNPSKGRGKHSKDTEHGSQPHPGPDQTEASKPSNHSSQKKSPVYHLREMISLDDAPYTLSYQYHPGGTKMAAGDERIDPNFLPTLLDGVQHHKLHRWTGLTHILTLTPVTISDIFASSVSSAASAIIDLSSAKLLLSSFAIAFQNTGCKVPVFVPTGQPWNLTFTGLGILPQAPLLTPVVQDEEEEGEDEALEVRYNTVLVPHPPLQYTNLGGIMDLFIERMGLEDMDPARSPGVHGQIIKERIKVSAMFNYGLVNWYDEDWRRWKEDDEEERQDVADSTEKLQDSDMPFKTDEDEKQTDLDASMNMQNIKTEEHTSTTLPLPTLPFGPVQDPLRSMRLSARFSSAPSTMYLDSQSLTDMDASHANYWLLNATFKEDDYGILSGILEDAVASWSTETSRSVGSDRKSNRDQNYGSLLHKGARLIQGTITMVDAVDVENIVDALFDPVPRSQSPAGEQKSKEKAEHPTIRLVPTSELSLHFRHATAIPYDSFLWRMVQYLVDVISPNSEISYATSLMGFMKVLWSELLKKFYLHWENSELIPLVDIFGDGQRDKDGASSDDSDQERKPIAIDLRYNLLHQKLSMLNCCIARQIARNKDTAGQVHSITTTTKRRKQKSVDSDLSLEQLQIPSDTTSLEPSYGAQFQNLLHGLSDMPRPRSADVVPMAKRILETVKTKGVVGAASSHMRSARNSMLSPPPPPPPELSTSSPMQSGSSSSKSASRTAPSSPTASMPIPRGSNRPLRKRRSSSYQLSGHHPRPSKSSVDNCLESDGDDDEDVFYDPMETSEALLDESELVSRRGAHSLTESFVALKYSSSADSQSGVMVHDLDQTSVTATGPDPREVADETQSEGGVKPLKDLKLLETGKPLLIPKLQEPGYMTEDMIQQQEELFETLGSSSDAAKMRAKMQSMQLISDMEAFKAANPGCVLGDFIRWHSPKDWVEDKGEMSARMADAGNYWQELWSNSKRIPVARQTPLFNHNREAAKVLFYLDSISGDQLFILLLPTMCLLAYDTLVSHPVAACIQTVAKGLQELGRTMTTFPWNDITFGEGEGAHFEVILEKFRKVELVMGRAISLIRKFPGQFALVDRILGEQETVVNEGTERESVYDLFSIGGSMQSSFPQPTSREFVLEVLDPMPTSPDGHGEEETTIRGIWDTRPLTRRMYACFKESEARFVESVTKDSLYA